MSNRLTVYMIDVSDLRRRLGSKDKALLQAVLARENPHLHYDVPVEGKTLKVALQEMIDGKADSAAHAFMYAVMLEELVSHLGTALDAGAWNDLGAYINYVEGAGIDVLLDREDGPLPLPFSDEPGVAVIPGEEVGALAAEIEGRFEASDPDDDMPPELLGEYAQWLRTAERNGKGVVMFYV